MSLLTKHNAKLLKNDKFGWKSFGLHLSPYKLSGKNFCPNASKGCAAACLSTAGLGKCKKVQDARLRKSLMFINKKQEFMLQLMREINAKLNTAKKTNQKICFRLNLTSDLAWEKIKINGKNLMEHFPEVIFYDYCKSLTRMKNFIAGKFPSNYHLTFSRSESNTVATKIVMGCRGNVAVVFDNKLPKTFLKKKVVSGMESDLRFLDKKGVVIGLIALGRAKKDKSGFVVKTRK